jgi:DNA polymerase-3 subunit delta'
MSSPLHPWNDNLWQRLVQLRVQLPHALLLHGRAGIGKLAVAERFVRLLLCEQPQAGGSVACGQCPSCHWMGQGSHPDFRKLQPAALEDDDAADSIEAPERKSATAGQQISVAQIRSLNEFVHLSTHRGGLRVALIHPAEALNNAAANALLKTLEEPPAHVVLILVSHHPSRLLPTILSRCHQLRFTLPDPTDALAWLNQHKVQHAAACLAQAGGAPLLAQQLAETDYQARRQAFLTGLLQVSVADSLRLAEQHAKHSMVELIHWLQQWQHDLLSLQLTGQLRYQGDFAAQLRGLAGRANLIRLLAFEHRLQAARASAQHPLNPQMVLEDVLLEYANLFV